MSDVEVTFTRLSVGQQIEIAESEILALEADAWRRVLALRRLKAAPEDERDDEWDAKCRSHFQHLRGIERDIATNQRAVIHLRNADTGPDSQ